MDNIYRFSVKSIDSKNRELSEYAGQVLLIVNVASKCGYTPQYEGLEGLYQKYKEQGFTTLGLPCNQFGAQEPEGPKEIKSFCELTYDVTFPLCEKIDVNGKDEHPLYTYLKSQAPGILGSRAIKWNFTKFLIGRDGKVIKRYAPRIKPEDIAQDIEKALFS